ncbi:hypothetical protein D9758_002177 [Tetrapyrgos nigripes]|uniref:Exonuclease domain-containing protein n=1 Tax=Tetrapyrgos nigripes TaxID=182062 RepID=A0A8H5LT14_9AGAR|nr:hypothetical protein D9758_002177 [Tetrapyrgos nigripes]
MSYLPEDTTFYASIILLLTFLVMLALYRPHLRPFLSRTPRPTISHTSPGNTKSTKRNLHPIFQTVAEYLPWANVEKVAPNDTPGKLKPAPAPANTPANKILQPFDAFLVLDFEGTCTETSSFDYPNELIEFPVILMRWKDKDSSGKASELVVVDQFHSFIRPTWKPKLTEFCTKLTGITQYQVDIAPDFFSVLLLVRAFLVKHDLIDSLTGHAKTRFSWCQDGPWDLGDLLTKQCFHSRLDPPKWLQNNIIDVRRMVKLWMAEKTGQPPGPVGLNIEGQLAVLDLKFEGRLHSGLDDTKNISRIVAELARRGLQLQPNLRVTPRKRFGWMGKSGRVLEDRIKDSKFKR